MLKGKWCSDAMMFLAQSIVAKEKAAQLFTNGRGFDKAHPIKVVKQCSQALSSVIQECGILESLVVDNHKSQGALGAHDTDWGKPAKECQINQSWTQLHCWWQNAAEQVIGEIGRDSRGLQGNKQSPKRLWSCLVQHVCVIRQRTASIVPLMMGRTGFELVNAFTPDVSLCVLHEWCDFAWWLDMHDKQEKLGRWSGPVGAQFGGGDCHWILFKTGKVHLTNTARPIEPDQWKSHDFKNNIPEES